MLKTISNFYVVTLLFCTLTIGLILSSSHVSSASTTADAAVTVGSACTFTGTVSTAHNAEVPNGTNRTDIGSTVLNTICNDNGGFAIYAVGYSSSEYGNNTMINQADSTITFNTGTSTSGNNSNWSMKLAQVTTGTYATTIDNSFNSYHNVPATYTKVAHRDSVTDASSTNPAVGSSISLTYQTYISGTQAAGTYQGKVKFTMVHPANKTPGDAPITCTGDHICYSPNANNTEGTMGQQEATGNNAEATLLATNYSRQGYGFAGWSEDQNAANHLSTATIYGPNETITTKSDHTANGLSLYAVWIPSVGSLQNWSGCSGLQQGSVTALTDQRDNDTYAVAKLADGNCWMIENLRLDNTAAHNSDGSLAQGYAGQFAGLAFSEEPALFTNVTTANSLYSVDGSTEKTISGNNQSSRFPRYNNSNTTARSTNSVSNTEAIYSYGNYYSWAAAIASTANYPANYSIDNRSVCPSGWHLPKGGGKSNETNNEYWALVVTGINGDTTPVNYDSSPAPYYEEADGIGPIINAIKRFPNNFIYSGYVGDEIYTRGSRGYYWSSTSSNTTYAYNQYFSNNFLSPGTNSNLKYSGCAIRCTISNT